MKECIFILQNAYGYLTDKPYNAQLFFFLFQPLQNKKYKQGTFFINNFFIHLPKRNLLSPNIIFITFSIWDMIKLKTHFNNKHY